MIGDEISEEIGDLSDEADRAIERLVSIRRRVHERAKHLREQARRCDHIERKLVRLFDVSTTDDDGGTVALSVARG